MTGLLLVQLGTPDSPSSRDLRVYLREFLMDPRVISIPAVFRWLLVNLIICPFRSPRSAEAYKSIWMKEGSPLRIYSERLTSKLQSELGVRIPVRLAMRYGRPNIQTSMDELRALGCEKILVLPLYPQYAPATTASVTDKVFEWMRFSKQMLSVRVLPPFFQETFFISSFVRRIQESGFGADDHLLISFHGLPESQIRNADMTKKQCLQKSDCCETYGAQNAYCYRAQCFETARLIAKELLVPSNRWTLSFQSRLGRDVWLGPATVDCLTDLAKKNVSRVVVTCPAFVTDCLETLEEIGIQGRKSFMAAGGTRFGCAPCPNDESQWILGMKELVLRQPEIRT